MSQITLRLLRRVNGWLLGAPGRAALLAVLLVTLARIAYLWLDLIPLFGDEAQYWSWSRELAFGYYSKPPMVAWLIAATTSLAGSGEPAVKLASPLTHAVTALMIFLIGRRLGGGTAGLWSCLLYLTMPAVSYSSAIISTDPPLLMFWSLALYAFIRAMGRDDDGDGREPGGEAKRCKGGWHWWILVGLGLGAALLSKYTAVAFPFSAALYLVVAPQRRRLLRSPGPYVALVVAVITVAPNIMWNAANGWVSIRHVGDNAQWAAALFHPVRLAEFVLAQFGVFGPLPFACLLIMIRRWRSQLARCDSLNLLLCFVVPLLALMCLQALVSRAYANWAAPIYVAATVAVTLNLIRTDRLRWIKATVAVHLALGLALASSEPLVRAFHIPVPARFDLLKRVRGWPEVGRELELLRRQNPGTLLLADDRMTLAECLYYGSVPTGEAYSWNPDSLVRHHYDLVSDMNDAIGRDFLFVSIRTDAAALDEYFSAVKVLTPIVVPANPDRSLRIQVYRLEGFRGCQSPRG